MTRLSWAYLKTRLAVPDYDDPGADAKVRAESLDFEKAKLVFHRDHKAHLNWRTESWVRFIFTLLAAFATWQWVKYVMSKVDLLLGATSVSASQEHIVIALMTTFTANILGVWAIVAKYIWRIDEAKKKEKKKEKESKSKKREKPTEPSVTPPPDDDEDDPVP